MFRLLLFVSFFLASGCADCVDDDWNRFIWVGIQGMPGDSASASLTLDSELLDVLPCTVVFDQSNDSLGEVVDDSECLGTMANSVNNREWFVGYPINRTFPRVRVSFEVVTADGSVAGFDEVVLRPDWRRNIVENGFGCTGSAAADLLITQSGDIARLP